ncbi:Pyruvate kinase [Salinispira pacifica]|uniref:Pyruvate kinase n=2 Tax=Salinispira pacifica TaxID=1307761 RepID=V5WJG0_9SPIO|nr:Pyruvate kinase [Salinispira pacifica]
MNCEPDFIRSLYDAGMSAVRLNTAHQEHKDSLKVVENVRKVSDAIPLVLDTKGPEVRTTKKESDINVKTGDIIKMIGDPDKLSSKECVYLNYKGFVEDVPVGKLILIDDGDVALIVKEKKDNALICEVQNDGEIGGKKSVNVPGVHIHLPALSDRDRGYIDFAIEHEIDFIAHSFVRNKEDVQVIQDILDEHNSKSKIIAKIENQEGVENIDEIIDHVHGIMVARGDLGIEIPAEKIPAIQKMIIRKCREKCKPVITATQMLHTMIKKPRPTRAEVSDVANAVYDGTDSLMLSGETAYGDYPLESVQTMAKIAKSAEEATDAMVNIDVDPSSHQIPAFLARTAVKAESKIPMKGIVIDTSTGRTARYISAFRGNIPIYVECYDPKVMRQLAITYGVTASYMPARQEGVEKFINKSLNHLVKDDLLQKEDTVLVLAGNFGPSTGASFLEISTVKNMLQL